MKVWCAHKDDLKIMFPNSEIFNTKHNYELIYSYNNAQPYILKDGNEEEFILSDSKSNWKEELLKQAKYSDKATLILMDIDQYLKQDAEWREEEYREWRKSLGGKSPLQHLAEITSMKKAMEEDPDILAIDGVTRAEVGLEEPDSENNESDSSTDKTNSINNIIDFDDDVIEEEGDDLPF